MGIYDFNMPKNNIDTVIEKLREELRTIMASSQSNINELARRIASDEKLLNELRNLVNDLPDYTAQYEELKSELRQVKDQLQNLADHPIDLGTIDIQTPGGLVAEVQKINGQYLYADRSIKDISGRPIIDTYATKDELGQDTVSILNNLSTVSGILNTAIANERDERVAAITAEATAAKVVTLSNYELGVNGIVAVKFTYGLCANATLNINGKGAKPILIRGTAVTATTALEVTAGLTALFIYDGTNYHYLGTDRNMAEMTDTEVTDMINALT